MSSASWFHDPRSVPMARACWGNGNVPMRGSGEESSAGGVDGSLPGMSVRLVVGILVNNKRACPLVFS